MKGTIESIIEQKRNTFDHIFYEFEMYCKTYSSLLTLTYCNNCLIPEKQFWINVLWESHTTHLRILIRFFSGHDSLNVNTVLNANPRLGISESDKKEKIISQTISHLTSERSVTAEETLDLSEQTSNLIFSSYPEIKTRIIKYLDVLSNDSSIKEMYIDEFHSPFIQERYDKLCQLLKDVGNDNSGNQV